MQRFCYLCYTWLMPKPSLLPSEVEIIHNLRQTGHSLLEIKRATGRGYGTVSRYIKGIQILPQYQDLWRVKRGGSKNKAQKEWETAKEKAGKLLLRLDDRDKLIVLAALYWGEGTKRELNIINSDPGLISVFMVCLKQLGVTNDRFKISLRIFEDMDREKIVAHWERTLGLARKSIKSVEVLRGREKGKLKFGMCRVRVSKSKDYFKLIMSMIDFIKSDISLL